MSESLHDIVKETSGGVAIGLSLPVREAVGEEDIDAAGDQSICSSVLVLVPAVRGSNLEARNGLLDLVDSLQEFGASKVAAVHRLGSNGDGVDLVLVVGSVLDEGCLVLGQGLIVIGPASLAEAKGHGYSTISYQTPRMTLNPAAFAAGRISLAVLHSEAE